MQLSTDAFLTPMETPHQPMKPTAPLRNATMKRQVESTEDFKLRIAAMLHDKPERVTGAQRPHPMLVRKKRVAVRKRRRR